MHDACTHCDLPLGPRPLAAVIDGARRRFCCPGCLLAFQVTRTGGEEGATATIAVRLGLAIFFAMNAMMLAVPTYAPAVYGVAAEGPLFLVLRVMALVLTAPVLLLLGGPILAGAWPGLRAGAANADGLVVLGTLAAYALSVANTARGRPGVYVDTAAMLLVLVTLGRYLEARARVQAGAAIRRTLAPVPMRATRIGAGDIAEPVDPGALVAGETVLVHPGEIVPTDGTVIAGTAGVDESALTGESAPVPKDPGAAVAGGTCVLDGVLRVRVTAPASASAAARIAALLDAAGRERTVAERTADRVSRVLLPLVLAVAAAAAGAWTVAAGPERGLLVGLAVLVVACPCGLGLATPVAVWMGLVHAARRGVVVRSGPVLERAAAIGRALFDKTGTLTGPTPALVAVAPAPGESAAEVLALAAALEAGLRHPLAAGTMAAAEARGVPVAAARDVRVVPGRGVRGIVDGRAVAVGSPRLAADVLGRPVALGDDRAGVLVLVGDGRMLGTLRFREAPRCEARDAIEELRGLGVHVGVLTGDTSAGAIVPALVAASDVALGLLPENKVAHLRALRGVGGERAVAMVGDGINDAPALAAADVGIALAGATDLARLTADAVVLGGDLRAVPWLVAHARRVRRVVRQNLAWAFAYNAGAVAVAAAGALDPVVASLAMVASSVAVVANARRLGRAPRRRSGHLGPRMTAPAVDPHGGEPVVPAGAPLGEALADPLRVEVEAFADAPEREHAGVLGREPFLDLAEEPPPARGPGGGESLEAPHPVAHEH